MKNILLLFSTVILTVQSSTAQWPGALNAYLLDTDKKSMVGISTDAFFGSEAVTNRLATDYMLHRFITDEVKSDAESKMTDYNRLAAFFNGSINFAFRKDSSKLTVIGTVQHHFFLDSRFSSALFDLYFQGNRQFAGETAWVGSCNLRSILYYQIGGGLSGLSENKKTSWFALGSVYFGHEVLDIETGEWTSLYTAPDGTYLDADLDVQFIRSDSTNTRPMAVNGLGAGISGGVFHSFSTNWKLNASVTDLGFITFNQKTADAAIDTAFRFEGIDVRELFSFNDSIRVFENDSSYVEAYFTDRKEKRHTRMVPGHLDLSIEKTFVNTSYSASLGSRMYFSPIANPMIWLEGSKKISANTLRIRMRYGGYTGLNFGFAYGLETNGWKLDVGSDVLNSWLSPRKGTAMGAFVSLSKTF